MTRTTSNSILSQPTTGGADVPDVPIYRLSVEQYHTLVRSGVLTPDDRVELLEGWLVPKMTKNAPHTNALRRLRRALEDLLPAGWFVGLQDPLTLADSEPEPDGFVVSGNEDDFEDHHPGASEVALVVEVADTTLYQDRGIKQRTYARAKLPVYWIVNLVDRWVEVYTDPSSRARPPRYAQRQDYTEEDAVPVLLGADEVGRVAVRDLLPRLPTEE